MVIKHRLSDRPLIPLHKSRLAGTYAAQQQIELASVLRKGVLDSVSKTSGIGCSLGYLYGSLLFEKAGNGVGNYGVEILRNDFETARMHITGLKDFDGILVRNI